MPKQINISLNTNSINDAIKYFKDYQQELQKKNQRFVKRLLDDGYAVANYYVNTALGDSNDVQVLFGFIPMSDMCIAQIMLEGNDALFVEFGAGATYNPNNKGASNPLGEGKYGVGTYPNQTHAYDPNGWWYTGDDGKSYHSYGTEATMPLYNAQLEIMKNVTRIAREVFR